MRALALLLVLLAPALAACSGGGDASPGRAGVELSSEDALRADLVCAHR